MLCCFFLCVVGVDLACFVALWCIGRRCFGVWRLFWPDIYCVKNKNLHAGRCLFFAFLAKMA